MNTSNESSSMGETLKYVIFDFWDEYGQPQAKGKPQRRKQTFDSNPFIS